MGKISALVGVLTIVCVVVAGYSLSSGDYASGPIIHFISWLLDVDSNVPGQMELKSVGYFGVYESNMRLLLQILTALLAVLTAALAVYAAKFETTSFWYSIGVFSATTSLFELHYIVAALYAVIVVFLIIKARNGKMTLS